MNSHVFLDSNTRRLVTGLVASILAHAIILWGIAATATGYGPRPVLQIELRRAVPESVATPLAIPGGILEIAATPQPQEVTHTATASPAATQPDATYPLNLPFDIYYASSEVDNRAEPENEIDLVYPVKAYQQRISGTVRLSLFVNERGELDRIVVVHAQPQGMFEEAALEAVRALKFSPAIKNGLPVKNRKTIEVNFDPYEKINTP